MKKHTAPIIAAILLLLPVLYVGVYLGLVRPPRNPFGSAIRAASGDYDYKAGGIVSAVSLAPGDDR